MSAQPQLIPIPADHPVRKQLRDVPVIVGHGLRSALRADGRRMSGTITLDKPNPMGRRSCTLNYAAPKSWSAEHHEAALRVAAHWFRDIGKFQIITKSVLCHVVQRLQEGTTEREMHAAINTYAASKWHREGKRWTVIQKFFLRGQMEKCIDESPELRRERDLAEQSRTAQEQDAKLRELHRRQDRERDERIAKRKAAAKQAEQPNGQTANQPSIAQAIESLPQRDRWVIPTLLSRKATPEVKDRARAQAARVCELIWPHLPASIKHQVESRIALQVYARTGQLAGTAGLDGKATWTLRWPQLIAVIQQQRGTSGQVADVGAAVKAAIHRPPQGR